MWMWTLGIILLVLATFVVVMGLITRRDGASFWDGVLLFCGAIIGADALERNFHIEPRCPWPGCNYNLQRARHRLASTCPACKQPIRWANEGRTPHKREAKRDER